MAERTIIVQPGQCLEDIALQEFGNINGVTSVVRGNEDVFTDGYATDLAAGTELRMMGDPIDAPMRTTMRKLGVIPSTNSAEVVEPEELGSFNDSFNDSFLT